MEEGRNVPPLVSPATLGGVGCVPAGAEIHKVKPSLSELKQTQSNSLLEEKEEEFIQNRRRRRKSLLPAVNGVYEVYIWLVKLLS